MKKMFVVLFMLFSAFLISAQDKKADIVVLLDTSGTMLPYYTDINNRVLSELCSEFVRIGDTFHLISFAELPASEISQRVNDQSDVQKIVSRFSLLYPLGAYSDFLNALLYSLQYIASLDVYSQKVLVIISDGIFNPSRNSPYFTLEPRDVEKSIQKTVETMAGQGVYIYYIKAPFPENTELKDFAGNITQKDPAQNVLTTDESVMTEYATQLQNLSSVVSSDLNTVGDSGEDFIGSAMKLPLLSCPQDLGKKRYSFTLPLTITNNTQEQILLQLDKILIEGVNVLDTKIFISIKPEKSSELSVPITLPSSFASGQTVLKAQFIFADNVRTNPQSLEWSMVLIPGSSFLAGFTSSSIIIIVIIAALVACLIVLFIILSLSKRINNARIRKENEHSDTVNQIHSDIGTLSNAKVSSAKLTLPVMADKITSSASDLKTGTKPSVNKDSAKTLASASSGNSALQSNYTKPASLTIDSSKISSYNASLSAGQPSIAVSDAQKNSASQLANYKQDNALSLSASKPQVSSNKLMLPQMPKSSSTLNLPSLKSLALNSSVTPASSSEKIPLAKEGTIILELFVEGQTRKIGTRNIHALTAGSRKSVGGGLSIFSIFFVKVPSSIAEIRYDGHTCTLALLRPEYFPEAESNSIENCLNVPVTIRAENGFITTITFTEYESQTDKLNTLLLSVVPEEDKKKYIQ